ncbi:hrp65 protein-like [Bombus pyrosoma]|uniref:hrp65 protein-like n=1 Tax=Bombus pyrosoma TaxID=396416 RepID=UPI001CB8C298|nr:hrp65 protein-like [Bombus pyrosoma]
MAGIEIPKVIQEPQNASTENSNENPRERNPPGDNRSPRGRRGGTRFSGGRGGGMSGGNRYSDGPDRVMERIMNISGPTHDLPPQETTEKKFSGRNRLYIGNLTNDVTEEEIQQMFQQYGETSELFLNKEKNFSFVKMDYRVNAEKAKHELDRKMVKGRALKVRFAPLDSTIKVKNLTPWISNELLEKAFSVFGEIERAIVIVDKKGKSSGEGIIEFCKKNSAQLALRKCTEGCYRLTASPLPVIVELFEQQDDIDGYPDKTLPRTTEFFKAREIGPRFAEVGSFEYEYGTRWKQLYELRKQKIEAIEREMAIEEEKLEAQMEFERCEFETKRLREELRMREADRERQKREWEMKERQAEEQRTREEELRRRQQEEMAMAIRRQEEELHRRQQENNLFLQGQAMRGGGGSGIVGKSYDPISNDRDGFGQPDGGSNMPVDPKTFMNAYNNMDRGSRGVYNDDRSQMDLRANMGGNRGGGRGNSAGGRWQGGNDRNRQNDYPNKRRRY